MSLDFAYTCPIIDRNIREAKQTIEDYLASLIEDICPYLDGEKLKELAKDNTEPLYKDLECIFEKVRETNEDMRKQAERQIKDLESEIQEKDSRIQYLEDKYM
jgi:gas vesicle protein